ncbi:MAG: hypothetical protein A3J10_01835 [Candidatus Sungbacteria bacterium RIFCSPLOWO2_02_FULL_54_10]|uniref:GTPase Obg n=1 Tax=Candidatus Sungbacteria bacterium RIFCSPLOWO2_01_FULL_54_21 TaxID=1802279 RepID=A0A1G2L8J4_9BACT|nr:MAG: hypothetical protein A3B34_00165 [Candidatus Sungbacteria bacterium RIFCSPLOWO2_01_FULL_54_21]OHA12516.1 MAG: hypothetical protein A3J10_01835 [Candidatus Sungbacteria bacterium RIFCSPLOWO2_02_FULL_54_10]
MAFIDEITLHIKAGDGGNGVVGWLHESNREYGGPVGGDGGRGGHVYVRAVRALNLLARYKTEKNFAAERGYDGGSKDLHGAKGKDLHIDFPIGSIITNNETSEKVYLSQDGEEVLLLKGGGGGRGNKSFKSPTNRRPEQWTPGRPGGEADFFIEVELIADIGLIGLPNAGKTTLLNHLTNAKGKIGAYPFTTLEPNLGDANGYIISDIPGLIEGAAEGKGLGHKFLRHVRRTKILVHLVSVEQENPVAAYTIIRKELENFDPELAQKKEITVLTKTDLIEDPAVLERMVAEMKKATPVVTTLAIFDDAQVKELRDMLIKEIVGVSQSGR